MDEIRRNDRARLRELLPSTPPRLLARQRHVNNPGLADSIVRVSPGLRDRGTRLRPNPLPGV